MDRIAPPLLSADVARRGDEVRAVVDGGADRVHVDVVDHHDAPDRRFAPVVCQASRPHGSVPIGVHLIVQPVDALAQAFANAGADNFVAGSAIFSQPDCRALIDALRAPHAAADLKRAA